MAFNQLTGNVIVNIEYRLTQEDESSHLEDHGVIDYDLALGSGTGIKQINDLWYADREFETTDSVNLAALSLRRFGQVFTTSFIGVSNEGNVKGVKLDNKSNETIYLSLPFQNFSGNIEVAASGSVILSNSRGWNITPSSSTVTISGATAAAKAYSLGFLGVALPLVVNTDGLLNYDYLSSGIGSGTGIPSGTLMIEWLNDMTTTGTLRIEYNLANSSLDFDINVSYLSEIFFGATGTGTGVGSGTGTMMPIEYLNHQSFDAEWINMEWTGFAATTGGDGTGFNELLSNPRIFPGSVPYEQVGETGEGMTIGYPGWYTSGDYISFGWDSAGYRTNDFILGFARWVNNWTNPFSARCVDCRKAAYIKQTVTVVPGGNYRFEWRPTSVTLSPDQTEYPYMRLVAGDGTVLKEQIITPQWMSENTRTWVQIDAIAIDTQLTVEFHKPVDPHPRVPPYMPNAYWTTYLVWGTNVSASFNYDRVSLYRMS
jgi:hypothetical protein